MNICYINPIKTHHERNVNYDFVNYLKVWNTASTTTDLKTFNLINMSYNGVQNAGTVFNTVGFNVWYPSSNAFPTISSVVFNGVNVCSTVTVPPTTKLPATTKAAITTVSTSPTSAQPIFLFC